MEHQIRYAKTSDGVNIAYLRMGEGPVLVDMPVAPWSDVQWFIQSPALGASMIRHTQRMTYMSYDNRGSGGSDRDVTQFSLETDVLDLEAVLDKVEERSVCLLATGHGGPAAITYAARHPERVDHLVLTASAARTNRKSGELALAALMESNYRLFTDTFAHATMGFGAGVFAREFAELMRGCVSRETAAAIFSAHGSDDVRDLLPTITAPALIVDVRAGASGGFSEGSRYLAANLPNARLFRAGANFSAIQVTGTDEGESYYRAVDEFVCGTPGAAASSPALLRTVLFTDIVGHTEMMQRLGDAKGRDVLREHERITRDLLKQHGGAEVKTMGDGFMASFGSVTSAVDCAIALQRAFDGALTRPSGPPSPSGGEGRGERVSIRIGLNAGEPIEEDGDLFGSTIILASRIAAQAGAGEILVPDTVRGLLSGKNFLFSDRGEFVPKGFDETVRLWDVRWQAQ